MRTQKQSNTQGYAAVLVAVILWGCTYLLLGELLKRFPPSELIAVRYSGSLLLTILVLGRSIRDYRRPVVQTQSGVKQSLHITTVPHMVFAVLAGFALAAAAFTQKYGIHIAGNAVHAAFLSALIAVCIPFLQKFLGDAVSLKRVMFPVGLAAIGTAILSGWKQPNAGDALLVACAVFYGLQAVLVGRIKSTIHYAAAHATACVCCVVTAVPFLLTVDRGRLVSPATTREWIGLAALTILCTFVPWNLVHYAQQFKKMDAYRVGVLYTLEPLVTAAVGLPLKYLGSPVLVEPLTAVSVLGYVLIVAANERMARIDAK